MEWLGWLALVCSCGATVGKLLGHSLKDCNPEYDGPPSFVSPLAFLCTSCGKTTEIIDTKQHGYDSEISKPEGMSWDSNYRGSGQRQSAPCPQCGASEFSIKAMCSHPHFDHIEDQPELASRARSISIHLPVAERAPRAARSRSSPISNWHKQGRGMTLSLTQPAWCSRDGHARRMAAIQIHLAILPSCVLGSSPMDLVSIGFAKWIDQSLGLDQDKCWWPFVPSR